MIGGSIAASQVPIGVGLMLAMTAGVSAEEAGVTQGSIDVEPREWVRHQPARTWLQNYDPTLISDRLYSESSYDEYAGGRSILTIENYLRKAFPLGAGRAFGLQLMVPVKRQAHHGDVQGLGDVELRAGWVWRLSPTLRAGIGLNSQFDTASAAELGSGALVLRTLTAVRWDGADGVNLGLSVEYSFTPRDEGSARVSALQLKFPVNLKLRGGWGSSLAYKPRRDFEAGSTRHRISADVSRSWGAARQYAVNVGTELPLASDSLNWKSSVGVAWYFHH